MVIVAHSLLDFYMQVLLLESFKHFVGFYF